MPEVSANDWESFLKSFPDSHLLQTPEWGELKASYDWQAIRVIAKMEIRRKQDAVDNLPPAASTGAQVLFRRLIPGFSFAYIPKGPIGPDWKDLWPEVDEICRRKRAVFLKVEPDLRDIGGDTQMDPMDWSGKLLPGFIQSPHPIQPRCTLIMDISGDEDQVLARMNQKTRYNIRLALKKGVIVHPSEDIENFYRLMEVTGNRDQFGVHNKSYYQRAYDLFFPRGACELLVAEYEKEPLAALMVFTHGRRAWYLYGASSNDHRDRMPNYLVQWEAIRWARNRGCLQYDLWGIPDEDEEILEAQFTSREDGLWGVYRFKRGFGAKFCRGSGAWDRVYQPVLYRIYRWWIKRNKSGIAG